MTKNKFQLLTEKQCNGLLKLSQKIEELFDGKIGTCKTDPVDSKLREDENLICSQ